MPIKSTFAAEIGEGFDKFKEFNKLFDKYRDALGKTPSAYATITKEGKEQEKALKGMTAAILAQQEVMQKEARVGEQLEVSSSKTAGHWRSIASSAKSFWGSLTGAIKRDALLGLIGLGGATFALDKLGTVAGSGLRSSIGLGTSYGTAASFGLTYGRVLDPGSFLGAVSQARGNIGSPEASALMSLGVPTTGGDTGKTAKLALDKIYELVQKTPEHLLGPISEGYGINNFLSIEDLRRLKHMSREEYGQFGNQFGARTNQLGISEDTLKKWQDFTNTLDTTGKRIEGSLIKGLVKAVPELERLSDAAATFVDKFFTGKGFQNLMDVVKDGLEALSKYLGTDKFKQDMHDIADGFAGLAEWVKWFAKPKVDHEANRKKDNAKISNWLSSQWHSLTVPRLPDGTRIEDAMPQGFTPSTQTSGTLAGIMDLVEKLEGSGDSAVSPAGAIGKFQIMPSTAAAYGVSKSTLFDPATNRETAGKLLTDLSKKYQTTGEVLAAYNAGPMIADYMKTHGDKSLPMYRPDTGGTWDYNQTQQYLKRAGINVTIDNNSSADVNTQAAGLGAGNTGSIP